MSVAVVGPVEGRLDRRHGARSHPGAPPPHGEDSPPPQVCRGGPPGGVQRGQPPVRPCGARCDVHARARGLGRGAAAPHEQENEQRAGPQMHTCLQATGWDGIRDGEREVSSQNHGGFLNR